MVTNRKLMVLLSDKTDLKKKVWRRKWQPTPVLLPGKSHGQMSMVGHSPWGCKESDTTEQKKKKKVIIRDRGYKDDTKMDVPRSYNYVHFIIVAQNV